MNLLIAYLHKLCLYCLQQLYELELQLDVTYERIILELFVFSCTLVAELLLIVCPTRGLCS